MKCLIRRITRKSGTGTTHKDQTVEVDDLSIGRGTDQDLYLSDLHVALRHAVIKPVSRGKYTVQARTPSGVQINGRTVQTGLVGRGDRIGVGRTVLRLIRPPKGVELAIEVSEAEAGKAGRINVGATSLAEAGLRKRRWAWGLLLIFLGLGLGIPLAQVLTRGAPPEVSQGRETAVQADRLDLWRVAGGDHIWDSGPMSRAHSIVGRECAVCHQQPFRRVSNEACLACHQAQPHHADQPEMMRTSGLNEARCASCHSEHAGSEGLVLSSPDLCADCHADPGDRMPDSTVAPVHDFSDGHAEFRVQLVEAALEEGPDLQRRRMTEPLSSSSGLTFPHDEHMKPDGVETPDGKEVLACRDCHQPGDGRIAMRPIRMEENCARCHELSFEPTEPERQLPHGDMQGVLDYLEDYYAGRALEGGYQNQEADNVPAVVRLRRRPGARITEQERNTALEWAERRAREVTSEVVRHRLCITCHTIDEEVTDDARIQWRVEPVHLNQDWFPHASFTHKPHLGMACTECHEAEQAEEASEVLMPRKNVCRDCHGGAKAKTGVASTCIDCHAFHTANELTMGPNDAAAEPQATDDGR